jgi:hypothetical protein
MQNIKNLNMSKFVVFVVIIIISILLIFDFGIFQKKVDSDFSIVKLKNTDNLHRAFPSIVIDNTSIYIAFREADSHMAHNGIIKVVKTSKSGNKFETIAKIQKNGFDLRDPKIHINDNGELYVLYAQTKWSSDNFTVQDEVASYISFLEKISSDKFNVKPAKRVGFLGMEFSNHDRKEWIWLWDLTLHKGYYYGATYTDKKGEVYFVKSKDGVNFNFLKKITLPGHLSEVSIEFDKDILVAVVRNDIGKGYFVRETPNNSEWDIFKLPIQLGGPQLNKINDQLIMSSRMYSSGGNQMQLYKLDFKNGAIQKYLIQLPSTGDTGYSDLKEDEDVLYMVYYSGKFNGKSDIYLARISKSMILDIAL